MSESDDFPKTIEKECPFPDCDWSYSREATFEGDAVSAEYRAEEHYERAHAGLVKVKLTFEAKRLHGDRDMGELRKSIFENPPELPGYELSYVGTEVIEEPDDHSVLEENDERE